MSDKRRPVTDLEKTQANLPHWEEAGAVYFVRFGLRRPPAVDLSRPELASLVVAGLRHGDGRRYWLFDYVVMPDHVHAIIRPFVVEGQGERVTAILQDLKHWLAREINRVVQRRGSLWQAESYDHVLRNAADYEEKATYIFRNPLTAGLVADPTEWPWWGRGAGVGK